MEVYFRASSVFCVFKYIKAELQSMHYSAVFGQ